MKQTTIITLLASWIWAFQGCDNQHKIKEAEPGKTSNGTVTIYRQIDSAAINTRATIKPI